MGAVSWRTDFELNGCHSREPPTDPAWTLGSRRRGHRNYRGLPVPRLTSFKQQVDIFTTPPKFFFTPTVATYVEYFRRADISRRLINTVIVASGSGLLSIVVGAMAGYALAGVRLRGAATF